MFMTKEMRRQRRRERIAFFIKALALELVFISTIALLFT